MSAPFTTNSAIPRVVQRDPSPTGSTVQPVFSTVQYVPNLPLFNQSDYFDNEFIDAPAATNPVAISQVTPIVRGTANPTMISMMNAYNRTSNQPGRAQTIVPVASTNNLPSLRSVTTIPQPTMQVRSQTTTFQPLPQLLPQPIRQSTIAPVIVQRTVAGTQSLPTPIMSATSNTVRINQPMTSQPTTNNIVRNTTVMLPPAVPVPNRLVSTTRTVGTTQLPVRSTQPLQQTVLVPTRSLQSLSQTVPLPVSMTTQRTEIRQPTILPIPVRSPTVAVLPTPTRTATLPMPVRSPTATLPMPVRNPTATLPMPVRTTTGTLPMPVRNPTATLPMPVRTTTGTLPMPVRNPTATLPMPVRSPTGTLPMPVRSPTVTLPMPVRSPTVTVRNPTTLPMPIAMPGTTRPRVAVPTQTTASNVMLPVPVRLPTRMVTPMPTVRGISPLRPNGPLRTMPPLNVNEELEDYDDDLQQAILRSTLEASRISPLPDEQEIEQLVRQTQQRPLSPMRMATRNLTQIEMDRQLREQQDMEYAAALSIDEEKARQAAEVAVLAAANAARAAENAAVAIRAVTNLRPPQLRYPSLNPAESINIKVRYPDGNNSNYVLHRDEPLNSLIAQIKYDTRNTAGFTLTVSPGTLLTCEPNTSLSQCGIANRSVILINYA